MCRCLGLCCFEPPSEPQLAQRRKKTCHLKKLALYVFVLNFRISREDSADPRQSPHPPLPREGQVGKDALASDHSAIVGNDC